MDVLWYLNRYGIGITIIAIITITYNYYSIWMYDDMGMTANVSAHAEAQGGVTRWVGCDRSFRPSCSINTARMTWGWVKLGYFYDLT